ncbi:hypothetical protein shn_27180 (plasmid) [Shinella sp. HZN7]|jgi:hypothetical protein|nr:hypothetical protein shn_27180 [Shinella sp. HZN7]
MQLNLSCPSCQPETPSGTADDAEAERVRRLIARMTEAKRMLDGLLANLALVETSMAAPEPDDPVH